MRRAKPKEAPVVQDLFTFAKDPAPGKPGQQYCENNVRDLVIGDKVRCIEPPGTGQLTTNHVYTVTAVENKLGCDRCQMIALDKWPMMLWAKLRFVLADGSGQGDVHPGNVII